MKTFISLAILCCVLTVPTAALTEAERLAEERQLYADCKDEEGATQEDIDNIFNRIVPTKQNAKCLLACVYELIGLVNHGRLQVEPLKRHVARRHKGEEKEIADIYEMIEECRVLQYPRQRCELSAAYMQCANDALIRRGIDPMELAKSANKTASTPAKKNENGLSFEEKLYKSLTSGYLRNVIPLPLSESSTGFNSVIQPPSFGSHSANQPSSYGFYSDVQPSSFGFHSGVQPSSFGFHSANQPSLFGFHSAIRHSDR